MVSAEIKLRKLISWHLIFEIAGDDKEIHIFHSPNDITMVKVKLDKASVDVLLQKRDQIISFLNQVIKLSGSVEERWEKKIVEEPAKDVEKWVRVEE